MLIERFGGRWSSPWPVRAFIGRWIPDALHAQPGKSDSPPGAYDKVDWNTRRVTGDAVAEITRLKAEDGGPMAIGGATLAGTAMRAGLIDEYLLATHPVLVGGGIPFFTALDSWVNLDLVERTAFPGGVLLTRYQTQR